MQRQDRQVDQHRRGRARSPGRAAARSSCSARDTAARRPPASFKVAQDRMSARQDDVHDQGEAQARIALGAAARVRPDGPGVELLEVENDRRPLGSVARRRARADAPTAGRPPPRDHPGAAARVGARAGARRARMLGRDAGAAAGRQPAGERDDLQARAGPRRTPFRSLDFRQPRPVPDVLGPGHGRARPPGHRDVRSRRMHLGAVDDPRLPPDAGLDQQCHRGDGRRRNGSPEDGLRFAADAADLATPSDFGDPCASAR